MKGIGGSECSQPSQSTPTGRSADVETPSTGRSACSIDKAEESTYQLISLHKARILYMQSIRCDPRQGRIVQYDHTIRVVDQSLHSQQGIVRLHDDVGRFGKHGISLDELFGESVV